MGQESKQCKPGIRTHSSAGEDESSEHSLYADGRSALCRAYKNYLMGDKQSSQSTVLGQVGIHTQNNDCEPLHSPHTNMNVLQVGYLNARVKTAHL